MLHPVSLMLTNNKGIILQLLIIMIMTILVITRRTNVPFSNSTDARTPGQLIAGKLE